MLSADDDKEAESESEAESSGEGELGTSLFYIQIEARLIMSDLNGLLSSSVVFPTVFVISNLCACDLCRLVIHVHHILIFVLIQYACTTSLKN